MSYDADLINAYRDQLDKIRGAFNEIWDAIDRTREISATAILTTDDNHLIDALRDAINDKDVEWLENLYKPKPDEVLIILPDEGVNFLTPPTADYGGVNSE